MRLRWLASEFFKGARSRLQKSSFPCVLTRHTKRFLAFFHLFFHLYFRRLVSFIIFHISN